MPASDVTPATCKLLTVAPTVSRRRVSVGAFDEHATAQCTLFSCKLGATVAAALNARTCNYRRDEAAAVDPILP
jgi:hypothetical protein